MNKIKLNGEVFFFNSNHLPLLIHGGDKAGASLFTITLAANLFAQGEKILFLSGYTMAKDEFFKQIGKDTDNNVLFFTSDESLQFAETVSTLSDLHERVVVIKNIELFTEDIFNLVSNCKRLIVSGDIDKSPYKQKILSLPFNSKVLFTPLLEIQTPQLNKYEGFLQANDKSGIITTSISS